MTAIKRVLTALVVLAACAGAAAVCWWLTAEPIRDVLGPLARTGAGALTTLPFDTLMVGMAAAALLSAAGWLVASTALVTVLELARQLAPGARAVRLVDGVVGRWSPALVRRVVAAALGTAVTAGLATGPALAEPAPSTPAARGHGSRGLVGLQLPDRTTEPAGPVGRVGPAGPAGPVGPVGRVGATARPQTAGLATSATAPRTVVVRPGDCLWSIAADLLPGSAPDAAVDTAWHRLHAANRGRVGPDPDLILPGTHLVVPDLTAADH